MGYSKHRNYISVHKFILVLPLDTSSKLYSVMLRFGSIHAGTQTLVLL